MDRRVALAQKLNEVRYSGYVRQDAGGGGDKARKQHVSASSAIGSFTSTIAKYRQLHLPIIEANHIVKTSDNASKPYEEARSLGAINQIDQLKQPGAPISMDRRVSLAQKLNEARYSGYVRPDAGGGGDKARKQLVSASSAIGSFTSTIAKYRQLHLPIIEAKHIVKTSDNASTPQEEQKSLEAPTQIDKPKQPDATAQLKVPKQPNATSQIESTKQPDATIKLNAPKQPEATTKMEAPKQPDATKKLDAPKQPYATTKLDAPKQPDATTKLDAPKQPVATTKADAPKQPDATSKLDAPKQPVATTKLDAPKQPDATTKLNVPKQPDATTKLGAPKQPDATTKLDAPKQPEATTKLDAPQQPDATTKLDAPQQPDATTKLDALKQPEATTKLDAPEQPDATTKLDAPKQPDATTTKEAPKQPDMTKEPDAPTQEDVSTPVDLQTLLSGSDVPAEIRLLLDKEQMHQANIRLFIGALESATALNDEFQHQSTNGSAMTNVVEDELNPGETESNYAQAKEETVGRDGNMYDVVVVDYFGSIWWARD